MTEKAKIIIPAAILIGGLGLMLLFLSLGSGKSKRESLKIINSFKERPDQETLIITISGRLLQKLRTLQVDFGDNSDLQVIESLVDEKLREKEFSKTER